MTLIGHRRITILPYHTDKNVVFAREISMRNLRIESVVLRMEGYLLYLERIYSIL